MKLRQSPMRFLYAVILLSCCAYAGDDASGPIQFSTDLSKPFTNYTMSEKDRRWSQSLVKNLKYTGSVVHFVRTSLPLTVDGAKVEEAVYQAVEKPDIFYVANSDAILQLNTRWPYNTGVAGFSMHAPRSRNFIVCLNLNGGVPFLSSTPVLKGQVTWKGHEGNRLK